MSTAKHHVLTLLSGMVKAPPQKALSLLSSSPHHTHESISIIIHHLFSLNMLSQAESFIVRLLSGKMPPPFFTIASLVPYLTTNSNSPRVYETIISAHIKAQQPVERVLPLLDELIDRGFAPSPILFNSVLKCFVKECHFEKAWLVFEKYKGRVGLDVYTFGILVKGCCESDNLERGFEVLGEMCDLGFSPNVFVYTTLIHVCCKKGDVEKAKRLFFEMEAIGLVANQYTYTVLINGVFKRGLRKDGFELFERMKSEGALPDLHTYNSVLNAYCSEGEMGKAFQLFDEMRHRGVTCNVVTYNILIEGLCKQGNIGEAKRLSGEMMSGGLRPSVITYNLLMDGYCRVGMLEKALYLHKELKSSGLSPTVITYNVLIAGCARSEDSSRVLNFLV
ncbi:pentatricopeptide repeat-containing protein At4g11690-like [Salvia splendens]|uniref:pentatricopeptide repeat-containing protein At4g11690-like n=1 Tax=Salvia splendens TaxID=180675 RepID=UPI001C266D9E|nr:pentatricopeptide repeat-containing protein At4g11690-like [Salvia splendens]